MRRKRTQTLTMLTSALVTGLVGVTVQLVRTGHWSGGGSLKWAYLAGGCVLLATVIGLLPTARSRYSGVTAGRLDAAAAALVRSVRDQGRWEAAAMGLFDPRPLPIRWGVDGARTESDIAELARSFWASPTRRLMITGTPGSGKSALALLLLLSMLDDRAGADSPVPVRFELAGWDPGHEPFHDWLADRLLAGHPWLASAAFGPDAARALVAARRILPILDGLDEAPEHHRTLIMRSLAATLTADEPLIAIARAREDLDPEPSRARGIFSIALQIELLSLTPGECVRYLRECLPPSASAGWSALLDALEADPASPVAQALSRPLMLMVLRQVYAGHGDPAELTDPVRFPDSEAVERRLLGSLVEVHPRATTTHQRFSPADTRRWLSFLVTRMTQDNSRDLAWWHLPCAISATLHGVLGNVVGAVLAPVSVWGCGAKLPGRTAEDLLLASSSVAGALLGYLATAVSRRRCANLRPAASESPPASLRAALAATTGWAALAGLAVGGGLGSFRGLSHGAAAGLRAGLTSGSATGLLLAMSTPGFAYLVAVLVFAVKRQIPFRLMPFLEYAEKIGLLRQFGPAYRLRYPQLQEQLANGPSEGLADSHVWEPAEEESERDADAWRLSPESPILAPMTAAAPRVDAARPATSKIDHVARARIREEALVLPEVLLKIDGSRANRSRDEVIDLVERLLTENADMIERAATTQHERYDDARRRLAEAAKPPAWSRPARLYQESYWLAGGAAGWIAGMLWLPVAIFRLGLVAVLIGCLAVPPIRLAAANRKSRKEGRASAGTYFGAMSAVLRWRLLWLIVLGLVCSLPFHLVGKWSGALALLWTACAVCLVTIVLWLSSVPSRRIRAILDSQDPAAWLQLPAGLADYRAAAEQAHRDWIGAMVRGGLLPLLREQLNDEQDEMATVLPEIDPSRLGGLNRIDEFIDTEGTMDLDRLIAKLGSASIGLSGARGAGKSTALRRLCTEDSHQATGHLLLLVHAPTAYDAKEFITHLFLKICERVTGDTGVKPARGRLRARLAALLPFTAVGLGIALLVGSFQWRRLGPYVTDVPKHPTLLVAAAGAALIFAGLTGAWRSSRRKPQTVGSSASKTAATAHLQSLRYLQAVTQTKTGEVALPLGVKLGGQSAVQRTEQARSYPELVADLRELLGQIALDLQRLQGKVIIGIDELDKIGTAADAERFLNELKVIFGVHGCFFLVALSEDALAGFERRSLAIRSTFDSTFDRIISIPPLSSVESQTLLVRRGIPLPIPYAWLCHAITGGLPRDLLRSVLDLTTIATRLNDGALTQLADRLIRKDFDTVLAAQLRESAQLGSAHGPAITRWLAECVAASCLTVAKLDQLADAAPPQEQSERLVVQTRAYLSILAALTSIFVEDPERCLVVLKAEDAPGTIDRIAKARLLLATDPHLASHTIEHIRGENLLRPPTAG